MEYFSYIQHSYVTTNEIHENFYRESGSYDENMPEKEGKNLFLGPREPRSVKLNLAIIQSKLKGIRASLQLLEHLSENKELKRYHLLPATQGIFHMKLGNYEKAIVFLKKALK